MKTYPEVLQYLFRQLPMYQRVGAKAMKKDLGNIRELCNTLGNPQDTYPTVHIGGTNGKGSTSHILASILQEHGLKVGLYTSPHYRDFRERIRIDGEPIEEEEVVEFVQLQWEMFAEIQPSFFEWSVALAFHYFHRKNVDIAIIEVGLGGRLDSTNILRPILSLITNVDYDHCEFLGHDLESIATEKAGIIKTDTPVILGDVAEELQPVFGEKAKEVKTSLTQASDWIQVEIMDEDLGQMLAIVSGEGFSEDLLTVDLAGHYQRHNLQLAVAAAIQLSELLPFDWKYEHFRNALRAIRSNTGMLGRWQIAGTRPPVVLDGAHNPGAIQSVVSSLLEIEAERYHIVFGMTAEKDPADFFERLPRDAVYHFCRADVPRAMPTAPLMSAAKGTLIHTFEYPSVQKAFRAAIHQASEFDCVLVTGSIFVVGEVLSALEEMRLE